MQSAEKSNVAWFKLAEFVGRKEKERAFSIYRLLAHSLHNDAFAAQLEGDLFLAFQDDRAIECYLRAAQLYEKKGCMVQAAQVYECLVQRYFEEESFLQSLLRFYERTNDPERMIRMALVLAREMLERAQQNRARDLVKSVLRYISEQHTKPQVMTQFLSRLAMLDQELSEYARSQLSC